MSSVAIVGGGISGLTAAAVLARGGASVTLFERSELGGRGRTHREDGLSLNLGPHALYTKGAARSIFESLGVPVLGGCPPARSLGLLRGELYPMPFSPMTAATTSMMTASEKWAMARWMAGLALMTPERLRGQTVHDWLVDLPETVRQVAASVIRLSCYSDDFTRLDAAMAAAQAQRSLSGVTYIDGGWQTLVDGLRVVCETAGVRLHTSTPVRRVEPGRLYLDDEVVAVDHAVLCVGPRAAAKLVDSDELAKAAQDAIPCRAACLNIALTGLVPSNRRFVMGVDRPLYVSVHSDVAKIAPVGQTVVHAAVYGAKGESDALRSQLEVALTVLIPDWRQRLIHEQWMPRLVVAHDVPRASVGGRRAESRIADGVWAAGDWVNGEYMLVDAAMDSARRVAHAILAEGQS